MHENYPYAIHTYDWATSWPNVLLVKPNKWKEQEGKLLSFAETIIVLDKSYGNQLLNEYPQLSDTNFVEFPNYSNLNMDLAPIEVDIEIKRPIML